MKLKTLLVAAVFAVAPVAAMADDVTDNLDAARRAYDAGNLGAAKRSLDMASGLLTQKLGAALLGFLPAAMDGWMATDGDNSMSMTMFGGGLAASRQYNNSTTGGDVKIEVLADSPLVASMSMMMSNPQIAMASGGTFKTFNGQQGLVTQDGQIQFLINNRFFITVSGGATAEEKEAYANGINFGGFGGFN